MAEPIKIGSFNMYKFSYQRNKENNKNFEKIAEIICGEDFDILAMQEVFIEAVIRDHLMKQLGPQWEYTWKQPISRSKQAAEGYAYLWKKNKFQLASGRKKDEDGGIRGANKIFEPRIYNEYSADPMLTNGRLARDPFYIRLESLHGWYEIRLINAHIMFSESKENEDEYGISISDAEKRRREFEALADIYCKVADKQYRSARPCYTFLLGDYNLNLKRDWTKSPYLQEHISKQENRRAVKDIITVQDQLTTLKGHTRAEPDKPARGFANNYDHFSFDALRFEGMQMPVCSRIDTVRRYLKDDFEAHKIQVSDHIPICLHFSFDHP